MRVLRIEICSNGSPSNTHTVNISCFVNLPVLICRMPFDRPIRASVPSAKTSAALGDSSPRLLKDPIALPNSPTPENPVLCFHALAHCPLSLTSRFALCFDTLTHSSSRNSPGMIFIHHALGVFSSRRPRAGGAFIRHATGNSETNRNRITNLQIVRSQLPWNQKFVKNVPGEGGVFPRFRIEVAPRGFAHWRARAKMIALTTIRHRLRSLSLPFAPDEPGVSSIQGNHAH
jgi:hypothetical protein